MGTRSLSRVRDFGGKFVLVAVLGLAASFFVSPALAEQDGSWAMETIAKMRGSEGANSSGRERRASRRFDPPSRLGGPVDVAPRPRASLSGGITWQANAGCVPGQLQGVLSSLVSTFGSVTVTSTCRSAASNRAAGGAKRSYHLSGEAVDFRVRGANSGSVYAFLSSSGSVGGLKHYGGGLFHIDTGPRRPM